MKIFKGHGASIGRSRNPIKHLATPDIEYYEITITETSVEWVEDDKGDTDLHSETFNKFSEKFKTMNDAVKFLEDRYSRKYAHEVTKSAIYRDLKSGKSEQVGWIFEYKNSDVSHASAEWTQNDWVEIKLVHKFNIPLWDLDYIKEKED